MVKDKGESVADSLLVTYMVRIRQMDMLFDKIDIGSLIKQGRSLSGQSIGSIEIKSYKESYK